jgi:hypothetical protein
MAFAYSLIAEFCELYLRTHRLTRTPRRRAARLPARHTGRIPPRRGAPCPSAAGGRRQSARALWCRRQRAQQRASGTRPLDLSPCSVPPSSTGSGRRLGHDAARHTGCLVRVGPVRIAISALAPFRPPGWGSVGCRTFVELNLSGALDARHHQGDCAIVSGGLCQRCGTAQIARR